MFKHETRLIIYRIDFYIWAPMKSVYVAYYASYIIWGHMAYRRYKVHINNNIFVDYLDFCLFLFIAVVTSKKLKQQCSQSVAHNNYTL